MTTRLSMPVCDVCDQELRWKDGYVLTTMQVTTSERYWSYVFKNQWAMYVSHAKDASFLFGLVQNQAGQDTGWLVCEECSRLLSFDREQAKRYARKHSSRPPGAGPADIGRSVAAAQAAVNKLLAKPSATPDGSQGKQAGSLPRPGIGCENEPDRSAAAEATESAGTQSRKMVSTWYVKRGGRDYGPFSAAQLKQLATKGEISPETNIKRDVTGEWVSAARVKGLFQESITATCPNCSARVRAKMRSNRGEAIRCPSCQRTIPRGPGSHSEQAASTPSLASGVADPLHLDFSEKKDPRDFKWLADHAPEFDTRELNRLLQSGADGCRSGMQLVDEVVAKFPDLWIPNSWAATFRIALGRTMEARTLLESAFKSCPQRNSLYQQMGDVAEREKNLPEALGWSIKSLVAAETIGANASRKAMLLIAEVASFHGLDRLSNELRSRQSTEFAADIVNRLRGLYEQCSAEELAIIGRYLAGFETYYNALLLNQERTRKQSLSDLPEHQRRCPTHGSTYRLIERNGDTFYVKCDQCDIPTSVKRDSNEAGKAKQETATRSVANFTDFFRIDHHDQCVLECIRAKGVFVVFDYAVAGAIVVLFWGTILAFLGFSWVLLIIGAVLTVVSFLFQGICGKRYRVCGICGDRNLKRFRTEISRDRALEFRVTEDPNLDAMSTRYLDWQFQCGVRRFRMRGFGCPSCRKFGILGMIGMDQTALRPE
jgi:hypothetical protein